ncbi:hypothetical protein MTO96_036164, partial [Rhipicephalus appendiculatus]
MFFSPTTERYEVGEPSDILWYEDFIIVGGFSKDAVVQQTSITSSFSVFGVEVWVLLFGSLVLCAIILSLAPGSRFKFLSRLKDNTFRLLASMFLE